MSNFIGFGSSSPLILISFGPARLPRPGSSPIVFGEGVAERAFVAAEIGGDPAAADAGSGEGAGDFFSLEG